MKEKIILGMKGFFIGIANIIPGVSGGTLALTLGIYEELLETISHLFQNFTKKLKFLLPIGIGAVLSILIGSKIITKSLDHFPFATVLFFIGLILGGIPLLTEKIKKEKFHASNLLLFLSTFVMIIILGFLQTETKGVSFNQLDPFGYFLLFLVGVVAAATMVVPGVSGSMVLLLLGYYNPILSTIEKLTHFQEIGKNLLILLPFGIGIVIGIIAIAKLLTFLFSKYETQTYYAVLGFLLASILTLAFSLFPITASGIEIVVGIILLYLGINIGYRLGGE